MSAPEPKDGPDFSCATAAQRTLKDLRVRKPGQPVYVIGHSDDRKGQEAAFQQFNIRLAVVKFHDGNVMGYDPLDLFLPCEIHDGEPYFEIRDCTTCAQPFPLTSDEFWADEERVECPECQP